MNNNIRLDWIKELRHGDYIQIDGELKGEDNGYCALGVLCSLYIQKNPGRAAWVARGSTYVFAETFGSHIAKTHDGADLPEVVKHWAGLTKTDPIFLLPGDEGERTIVELNDEDGDEFSKIADRIEFGAEKRQP